MGFLIYAADSRTSCSGGAICNGARRISILPNEGSSLETLRVGGELYVSGYCKARHFRSRSLRRTA